MPGMADRGALERVYSEEDHSTFSGQSLLALSHCVGLRGLHTGVNAAQGTATGPTCKTAWQFYVRGTPASPLPARPPQHHNSKPTAIRSHSIDGDRRGGLQQEGGYSEARQYHGSHYNGAIGRVSETMGKKQHEDRGKTTTGQC